MGGKSRAGGGGKTENLWRKSGANSWELSTFGAVDGNGGVKPTFDGGAKSLQLMVGNSSLRLPTADLGEADQFITTLKGAVRRRGGVETLPELSATLAEFKARRKQ